MPRHVLHNTEFRALHVHLRRESRVRTGAPADLRRFLHGVAYLVRTGIPWRDLPPRFGHWNSVFRRFRRWCLHGVWDRLLRAHVSAAGRAAPPCKPWGAAGAATAPSCTSWSMPPGACCGPA